MPGLRKLQLLEKVVAAAALAGWSVSYNGTSQHPFRLLLTGNSDTESVLVYIWNITHGGGSERPTHEYRIQITSVDSIDLVTGAKTLLLGYWEANEVFAGWDATRHSGPLTGFSPSLQIREEYLLRAHADGLAVCPRGSNEVAIAFTPSSFINYVRNLYELHGAVTAAEQVALTHVAQTGGEVDEAEVASLPMDRQTIVRMVAARQRATDFRRRVLSAYENRCAVCGVQLQLVDAAHIVPVKHSESNDETHNGLCLCALHHRAYDQGLIAVQPDYQVVINRTKLAALRSQNLNDGAINFERAMRPQILLPPDRAQRPNLAMLTAALRVRELEADRLEPPRGQEAASEENE